MMTKIEHEVEQYALESGDAIHLLVRGTNRPTERMTFEGKSTDGVFVKGPEDETSTNVRWEDIVELWPIEASTE